MAELSPLAAGLTPRELSDIVRAHFGNTPLAFGVLPGGARSFPTRTALQGRRNGRFPCSRGFPAPCRRTQPVQLCASPLAFPSSL